jgi:hypothetical protein
MTSIGKRRPLKSDICGASAKPLRSHGLRALDGRRGKRSCFIRDAWRVLPSIATACAGYPGKPQDHAAAAQRLRSAAAGRPVKILATGQSERRSFSSGPTLTPRRMVSGVKKLSEIGSMTWCRSANLANFLRTLALPPTPSPSRISIGHFPFRVAQLRDAKGRARASLREVGTMCGGITFLG